MSTDDLIAWHRLEAARDALAAHDNDIAETREDAMADLITDLGHLAADEGYDFRAIATRALRNWASEQAEADEPAFTVTLTIAPQLKEST
jgi:hypothetical protein